MVIKYVYTCNMINNLLCYPDQVIILGGGRWSRVICDVLCDSLPIDVPITVCSPRGYLDFLKWAQKKITRHRLIILDQRPSFINTNSVAVIVVNAAQDHVDSALWALERNASVLVEKPFAILSQEVIQLSCYASKRDCVLAAANVFRFNRYLPNFANFLPKFDKIISVKIDWIDPAADYRYDENKRYDPAIPVYVDCMSHIVSILQCVFNKIPIYENVISIKYGGSKISLSLKIGHCPCIVLIQRNSINRVRRIMVECDYGVRVLDFSIEPGVIFVDGNQHCADPNWNNEPRPLSTMLEAFWKISNGSNEDQRFSIDTALATCNISENVRLAYLPSVIAWLVTNLKSKRDMDDSMYYAISEIICFNFKEVSMKENSIHFMKLLNNWILYSEIDTLDPQSVVEYIQYFYKVTR